MIEPRSPALQAGSLPAEPPGKPVKSSLNDKTSNKSGKISQASKYFHNFAKMFMLVGVTGGQIERGEQFQMLPDPRNSVF